MTGWRVPALVALMLALGAAFIYDHFFGGLYSSPALDQQAAVAHNDRPGNSRPAPGPGSITINPLGRWPLAAFSDVLTRPVFSPSRRQAEPPPAPVVEEAPPEPQPEPPPAVDFTLYGIVASGSGRFALLRDNSSGSFVRLGEAHDFQGWTLETVGQREVVITKGEERRTLQLSTKKPDDLTLQETSQPTYESDKPAPEDAAKAAAGQPAVDQ